MSKLIKYDNRNPKSRFLSDKLLKYLLDLIKSTANLEERRKLTDRIAHMSIFPYVASDDNIYLGSLVDSGVSWFYLGADYLGNQKSSKNYRILCSDTTVLSREIYADIITVFGPGAEQRGYIQLFSNDVVINAILDEMSLMTDYSEDWWQGAIDIFNLWNKQNSAINFSRAHALIDNNYFLFEPGYCDNYHRDLLLQLKIYQDIERHPLAIHYFSRISEGDIEYARALLVYLGVPNRFSQGGYVDSNITKLFSGIQNIVRFPCDTSIERDRLLCELSQYVVFTVIRNNDYQTFNRIISDQAYQGGIAIQNVVGSYVSLRYSLFYGELLDTQTPLQDELRCLEVLHIQSPINVNYRYAGLRNQGYSAPFETLTNSYDQYHMDNIRAEAMTFYMWGWRYTHNQQLINNILRHLSQTRSTYIDSRYNSFVLEIIDDSHYNERQDFRFSMRFSAEEALESRNRLNSLSANQYLPGIIAVVTDYLSPVDTTRLRYEIMNVLTCDEETRNQIDRDAFWGRVYTISGEINTPDEYVRVWYVPEGRYDPERIILISTSPGEEQQAIISYISEAYGIRVDSIATSRRDWAADYRDLSFGIRSFTATLIDNSSQVPTANEIVALDDLKSANEEIELWNRLKLTRDMLLNSSKDEQRRIDIHVMGWQGFLKEKYHNHCQICGELIPEGGSEEGYTFKIHADSKNSFSDIASNVFCLCPTCRGDMQYGIRKRDLRNLSRLANQYISKLTNLEITAHDNSVLEGLSVKGEYENAFSNPLTCSICINGKQEQIYFSWEHFLRLAFMFYDDEKDYTYEGEVGNLMQLLRMLTTSE